MISSKYQKKENKPILTQKWIFFYVSSYLNGIIAVFALVRQKNSSQSLAL
jgi:hypothetical protein